MGERRNKIRATRAAAGVVVAGALTLGAGLAVAADGSDGAQHATAVLRDLNGNEVGTAQFTEDATGRVHVNVKVDALTAGQHGIHIHAVGDCTPFADAGGHHNPGGAAHGSHNGDLPNMDVNVAGRGRLNASTDRATLSEGPVTVFDTSGSALVIHALFDDGVTDPTGNSGGRIACGVIVAN